MIDFKFTVDDDIIVALQEQINRLPKLVEGEVRRRLRPIRARVLAELRQEPGKPNYPLRWKSERQRKAYFATNGFGHGIPYRRTGKLAKSWDVTFELTGSGGEINIVNDDPKARFVQGDDQQPFHIDTGWRAAAPIAVDAIDEIQDALIEAWFIVADPTSGFTR